MQYELEILFFGFIIGYYTSELKEVIKYIRRRDKEIRKEQDNE